MGNHKPLFLIGNVSTNGGLSLAMLVYQSECSNTDSIDPQYDPVVLQYGIPFLAHWRWNAGVSNPPTTWTFFDSGYAGLTIQPSENPTILITLRLRTGELECRFHKRKTFCLPKNMSILIEMMAYQANCESGWIRLVFKPRVFWNLGEFPTN